MPERITTYVNFVLRLNMEKHRPKLKAFHLVFIDFRNNYNKGSRQTLSGVKGKLIGEKYVWLV